jgi:hypothetical protein
MEALVALFVGKPMTILTVAAVFLAAAAAIRYAAPGRPPRPILFAAAGGALYAGWEWLVQVRTPEANIRVDLLLIWPALAILSGWAVYRSLRRIP